MNPGHLHIMLNHIPILASLFGAVLLGIGLVMNNVSVRWVALSTLLIATLVVVPVYLSGEEAEHDHTYLQEGLHDHDELEEHEEHAELSLWLVIAMGALAAIAGAAQWRAIPSSRLLLWATVVLGLMAFASMVPLALHGGKISHVGLRSESSHQ